MISVNLEAIRSRLGGLTDDTRPPKFPYTSPRLSLNKCRVLGFIPFIWGLYATIIFYTQYIKRAIGSGPLFNLEFVGHRGGGLKKRLERMQWGWRTDYRHAPGRALKTEGENYFILLIRFITEE